MKSLEIFSGAGGLAKGLEQAGFAHAAFIEFNKHACMSLRDNFNAEKVFFGDIKDFDFSTLSGIDIVAGGPPCQPFSNGGKHKAHNDSRDMFPYAIKAIEHLSPKAFVFENVKGLLRSTFSEYFQYILLRLTYPGYKLDNTDTWEDHLALLRKLEKIAYTGIKYNVHFKLLNAANYGVPQTRERVAIVGTRADLEVDWKYPDETHSEERLLWDMDVSGNYWKRHGILPPMSTTSGEAQQSKVARMKSQLRMFEPPKLPWQTIRDALSDVPDPQTNHGIPDHLYRDGARTYPGHTGSYIDWPSKTIKAGGHGVPGGENMIRFENDTVRYLTVYEAKRIQTFPDDFEIKGAWGEAMRQIGNAVPVQLASVIGRHLWETLNQEFANSGSQRVAA